MRLVKAWAAIDRLSVIWKSDLTDKRKRLFQAAVVSILLYGCTTWMLTKRMEKKLDGNYTRILRAILNNSWRLHPTKQQLYGHLPPITKTMKIRRTRHAGHCWRSRDELISAVHKWTPSHGQAKTGRPARTYIQQLCADTGCSLEDLSEAMDDREGWWERVRGIRADGATSWWWWYLKWFNCLRRNHHHYHHASIILVQWSSSFFFLYTLSASMWCIHKVVWTRLLPVKNCILFYRTGMTFIWSIAYRQLCMPLQAINKCINSKQMITNRLSWNTR